VFPVLQIYGPESSGKTTLAMHAMAEVQKSGGYCAFIDAEHAFDSSYAQVRNRERGRVQWPLPSTARLGVEVTGEPELKQQNMH
jgi:recombination protein RecA